MAWSKNFAACVLAVFALGTALCPCAQAVAELAADPEDVAILDDHAHHAEGLHAAIPANAHHHKAPQDAEAADAHGPPCHADAETGTDCGMSDAAEPVANPHKPEHADDGHWSLPAFGLIERLAFPDHTYRLPPIRAKDRKPGHTPVQTGDRLLI